MKFNNIEEATKYFTALAQNIDKSNINIIPQDYQQNTNAIIIPRLKNGSENANQYQGFQNLDVAGWVFQSLSVNLTYPSIGGAVSITSSMSGFTLGVGWQQQSFGYTWNKKCFTYTITGGEIFYTLINSDFFEVGRNPRAVQSTFCHN